MFPTAYNIQPWLIAWLIATAMGKVNKWVFPHYPNFQFSEGKRVIFFHLKFLNKHHTEGSV